MHGVGQKKLVNTENERVHIFLYHITGSIKFEEKCIDDEYGKQHSRSRFTEKKNTAVFELAQLAGITRTMNTYTTSQEKKN